MALTKEDILNAIADMSVMEVCELVEMMEEKFGVSAADCHHLAILPSLGHQLGRVD